MRKRSPWKDTMSNEKIPAARVCVGAGDPSPSSVATRRATPTAGPLGSKMTMQENGCCIANVTSMLRTKGAGWWRRRRHTSGWIGPESGLSLSSKEPEKDSLKPHSTAQSRWVNIICGDSAPVLHRGMDVQVRWLPLVIIMKFISSRWAIALASVILLLTFPSVDAQRTTTITTTESRTVTSVVTVTSDVSSITFVPLSNFYRNIYFSNFPWYISIGRPNSFSVPNWLTWPDLADVAEVSP